MNKQLEQKYERVNTIFKRYIIATYFSEEEWKELKQLESEIALLKSQESEPVKDDPTRPLIPSPQHQVSEALEFNKLFWEKEPKEEGKGAEETHYQKALRLLDKFIKETPKEEIERMIAEVDAMNIEGPTIAEYFNSFGNASLPAKSVDVNFLLVNALRHLENEQIKALADSLYERLPTKVSVTDELLNPNDFVSIEIPQLKEKWDKVFNIPNNGWNQVERDLLVIKDVAFPLTLRTYLINKIPYCVMIWMRDGQIPKK